MPVYDFVDYWANEHAAKVRRLPGLHHYVQNRAATQSYDRGREPDFDGVAETWFDDTNAMRALRDTAEYGAVIDDEANFLAAETRTMLIVDEIVIKDAPVRTAHGGGYKFFAFLTRRADLPAGEFQRYWRHEHGPLAAQVPSFRRYIQGHPSLNATRLPFDGCAIVWFDSWDDLRASSRSEEFHRTELDEPNFLAPGPRPFVITTEHVIELD